MTRIIVVGSLDWFDGRRIHRALMNAQAKFGGSTPVTLVTGGGQRGAEYLARDYADDYGWNREQVQADMSVDDPMKHRNREIVKLGGDVCLAFINGRSEWPNDAAARCKRAGIPVWRYVA